MKFLKLFISSVFVLGSLLIAPVIFAEGTIETTSAPQPSGNVIVASTVNIKNAKIVSQDNNNFKISFDLTNREGLQSGVKYGVQLVGDGVKGQYLADEKVYPENVTLYENSSVSKEILYNAPANLAGEYTLWISSKNTSGFSFGVAFVEKVSLTSSTKGININSDSCLLSIKETKDGKTYTLNQGVDIIKEENLVLNCKVVNNTDKQVSVIPSFETTYRTLYGDIVQTEGGDINPITFKALEGKVVSITLPKAKIPQAYDVKISLKEGENISNTIVVHYVLSGVSATIQNISLDKDYYKKGDTANLSFIWSPSADSFIGSRAGATNVNPIVIAEIKNGEGKLCASALNEPIQKSLSPQVIIPIKITSKCENPQVTLSLKDNKGNILSEKSFGIETQSKNKKDVAPIYYIILIVIILVIIIGLFIRNKKNSKALPLNILFPFFVLIVFGSILPFSARADSFILGEENGVHANVSINGIDSTYYPSQTISLSGTASVIACSNAPSSINVSVSVQGPNKTLISGQASGGGTLNGSASFTAPSTPGSYYMYISGYLDSYSFNKSIPFTVSGDGVCSSSHYYCVIGNPSLESDNSNSWTWDCSGIGGGNSRSCSQAKTPTNGVCSPYSENACSYGSFSDTPDSDTQSLWDCNGIYGGTNISCSKNKKASCGVDTDTCINGNLISLQDYTNYTHNWACQTIGGNDYIPCSSYKNEFNMGGTMSMSYCSIPAESSSCQATLSWNTINPQSVSIVQVTNGATLATGDSGNINVFLSPSGTSFTLSNSEIILDRQHWSRDCVSGTKWNGTKCVGIPVNGAWGPWSSWGSCGGSVCESGFEGTIEGTQTRTRTCIGQLYGGADCSLLDGGNSSMTQPCSITCSAANQPPSNPIITGPVAPFDMGVNQTFNFVSSDPEGSKIRYGIDWTNGGDGIVDQWLPAPEINGAMNHVESGVSQSALHLWDLAGTYIFKAMAQDYPIDGVTRSSGWTPYTVIVKQNTNLTATLLPETQIIKKGGSATLTWTSTNTRDANSCIGSGDGFVTGGAKNGSDSVSPETLGKNNYSLTCYGKVRNSLGTTNDNNPSTITKNAVVKVIDLAYCEIHPDDSDCLAYCEANTDDCLFCTYESSRNCFCDNNPKDIRCINPDYCTQNPTSSLCPCGDGKKGKGEEGIDCGGICLPVSCTKIPPIFKER